MSLISIRLLDGVVVTRDGVPVPLQPKRLVLLAYLLLESRTTPVRRDQLLALFWPESEAGQARNALRQALFALRSALGDTVVLARGSMELMMNAAAVHSDVVETLTAVAQSDHAVVDRLYRSDFLAGLDGGASPELEQWLEDTRLRFRRFATTAVRKLLAADELSIGERIAYLERLLMLAPYDEATAIQLVSVHAARGDRAAALETFRRFESRLRIDLEIEPSETLTALVTEAKGADMPASLVRTRADTPSAAIPTRSMEQVRAHTTRGYWRGAVAAVAIALGLGVLLSLRAKSDVTLIEVDSFTVVVPDGKAARQSERLAALATERLRGTLAMVPGYSVLGVESGRFRLKRAGTVVQGEIEALDSGYWRASANVIAAESEMLLQRIEVEGAESDTVVAQLIDRIGTVIATRLNMELNWGHTLHQPTNLAALSLFQDAIVAVVRGDMNDGITRFEQAWALDSTFLYAGILAAGNALSSESFAKADSLLKALAPHAARMLPLEQRQYRRTLALALSDRAGALLESHAIVALEPRAPFLRAQLAHDAWLANHPMDVLAALNEMNRLLGRQGDYDDGVRLRAASLHILGRYREELTTVDQLVSNASVPRADQALRIAPLAALGSVDSLRMLLARLSLQEPPPTMALRYRIAADELAAHGTEHTARKLYEEGVQWVLTRGFEEVRRPEDLLAVAELLLHAGSRNGADSVLRRHASLINATASPSTRLALLGLRGVLAAFDGRVLEAAALSDSLTALGGRGQSGMQTYRRARIRAALGDRTGAIRLLTQALDHGGVSARDVHVDPLFAPLRKDVQFQQLISNRE